LAALRFYQRNTVDGERQFDDIATNCGEVEPLDNLEIDQLCETLNLSEGQTYQQIAEYLDALPGVLALWWFMENVNDDHPHRSELFFYCRERVRRYSHNAHKADQRSAYLDELEWDREAFRRLEEES
jgi:hypothetical protein